MIKVKSKMRFQSSVYGNIEQGQTFNCSVHDARQFRQHDMIEEVDIDTLGKPTPSSSLQAAPVSQNSNATTSSSAETRESAKCSESTQALEQQSVTSSTPVTGDGGKSTQKKRRTSKKGGLKTNGQQAN